MPTIGQIDEHSANQRKRKRPAVHITLHPELTRRLRHAALTETGPLGKRLTMGTIIEAALAWYLAVPLADRELPQQRLELCPNCELGLLIEGTCRQCHWHRFQTREQKRKYKRETDWDIDVD